MTQSTRVCLKLENMVARHGQLEAVKNVSFEVNAGQVACLIGANGAGKTTLLRTLAGAHTPSSGKMLFDGQDVTSLSAYEKVRGGIAMSPEGRRLFGDMTVRENLIIGGDYTRKRLWNYDRVLHALPQIKPIEKKLAGALSGGQRQAVAIGRALMANPTLLLLDEVSLGLSPAAVELVYQSLETLKGEMTILLVEQDLNRATSFSDHVLCMAEGVIALQGAPDALTREQISKAYFGVDKAATNDSGTAMTAVTAS